MPTNLHQAFKSKAIGILMASTVLVTSSLAIAEDSGQNILNGSKEANSNEVLPNLQASANLTTPDGRNITIHPEAQTGTARSSAIYFHRPLFAFVPNPDTQNTDHSILWDKVEEEGHIYVKLKFVLSTPKFRELARAAVIEDDPSIFADKQGIKERDIDVRPWPLKLLRLSAKHDLTGRTYGVSLPESLRTAGDQIDVNLKIPTDKYDDFLNKLQNNRIKFSPSYTFKNSIVAFAQSATTISSDVTVAIDQALQTIQADEGQPIFQDDVRKLKNLLRQEITTTIRATDSQVLAHVTPHDISSQILKPTEVKFSTLDGNKNLLAKVEAYLAPIVRKMGQDNTDTKEKNDKTVDTQKQKLKLGASAATGASGSIELDKEQVKTLEKKHKIVLKQSEDKNVIEPHSIEINYVREGWQSSLVDIFKTVYLSTGRDGTFKTDSPVLPSFTIDKLNEAIGNETIVISPYNRVPRGVPMLSFRADIPKGWIALDGKEKWPNENWVPAHLRNTPVPDMSGAFARGAQNDEKIGIVNNTATLTVPAQNVDGKSFRAHESGSGGMSNVTGEISIFHGNNSKKHGLRKKPSHLAGHSHGQHGSTANPSYFLGASLDKKQDIGKKKIPIPVFNKAKMFDGAITGTHTLPEQDLNLSTPKNQPPHVVGEWIMRIE